MFSEDLLQSTHLTLKKSTVIEKNDFLSRIVRELSTLHFDSINTLLHWPTGHASASELVELTMSSLVFIVNVLVVCAVLIWLTELTLQVWSCTICLVRYRFQEYRDDIVITCLDT